MTFKNYAFLFLALCSVLSIYFYFYNQFSKKPQCFDLMKDGIVKKDGIVERKTKVEEQQQQLKSKTIFCKEHSDLTSYCVYENVCVTTGNEILYLTDNKQLENTIFEPNGNINSFDHYEKIDPTSGRVLEKEVNNPLPFRSFLTGRFVPLMSKSSVSYTDTGCHSILTFDFSGHNIFHWAMKVAPFYISNQYENECKLFNTIKITNRKSSDVSDWQKQFLNVATNIDKTGKVEYLMDTPINNIQCFKRLFVPGTSIYIFTGPKEGIQFRKRLSLKYNIEFKLETVVIVKRKNREVKNQKELEEFIISKVGSRKVETIYLDSMTFEEQVKIMSRASLLIAVHGAGLTNSIFLPSTAAV